MQVVVKEMDNVRAAYQRSVEQIGQGKAARAFARALSHEGRKNFTAVKRALRKQTDIPSPIVNAGTKFWKAGPATLQTIIAGRGSELSLKLFGAKQFSYGVRAKVWGTVQKFPGAFMGPKPGAIARSLGGHVFHRTGSARMPIEKMFGPSIPKEIVKDAARETFERGHGDVMKRVEHELKRLLKV